MPTIAAFQLPDTLFTLVAGGALIQAFVPVFVSFEKEHRQRETWRLTSLVYNVLLVTLAGLVLIAEFAAPAFVGHWLVPGVDYSSIWDLKHPELRQVMLLLGPNSLAVGIASIVLVVDTAFTSYLPDKASLAAMHNACILFALPIALFGRTLALAALPRLPDLTAGDHYRDFRRLVFKIVGVAVLISIPSAVLLGIISRPVIHILFQHGAFTKHSSTLTALVLIGYAIGLPGRVASELFMRSFYALKNAFVPFLTNMFAFAVRIGLIPFLLKTLPGKYLILVIPLAAAGAATVEAGLLYLLLLWRLRAGIKEEQERLKASASLDDAGSSV